MPTFRFSKLVRDKLPEIYKALGQRITSRTLIGKELLTALRQKLVEESAEIPLEEGNRAKIIDELSDVEQVMDDIKSQFSISDEELVAAKERKFAEKGGFSDGIFVESIELDENDEWVTYYRQEPEKYREEL